MNTQNVTRYEGFEKRLNIVGLLLLISFSVLGVRLWNLQVVRWAEFREQSESNRLRPQRLAPPRGTIIGRNGHESVVLADNRAARDLMFVPADSDIEPAVIAQRLEQLAHVDAAKVLKDIESAIEANQPHRQIVIRKDVPRSVLARLDEYNFALPGTFTIVRPQRRYLYGEVGGSLFGYLNEISAKELEAQKDRYYMGDLIGRRGLEKQYEDILHGRSGKMIVTQYARGRPQLRTDVFGKPYVEVDEFGHQLRLEKARVDAVAGRPIYVTLDIGLQEKAESLLKGEVGSIVVLNSNNGEILASASVPTYDPSLFVDRAISPKVRNAQISEVLNSKPNRMIQRSFQEVYAPGSTYKILMAGAALEEDVITADTSFYCAGKFRIKPGTRAFGCWKRSGHGTISIVDAIAFSCDVFFYNVGLELGVDRIKEWSTKIGFGTKVGLDLVGEVPGLIPSREWKEKVFKPKFPDEPWEYRWYPGETLNLSIGQGYASATPLQLAVLMSSVVNGGRRIHPHLRLETPLPESKQIWSQPTLDIITTGMRKCIEKGPPAPTGTGRAAAVDGVLLLGKTGSAQVMSLSHHEEYETEEDIPKHMRDHAWFIAAAPELDPPLAFCILVEHGHHGSSVAAPLAKGLLEFARSREVASALTLARSGGT